MSSTLRELRTLFALAAPLALTHLGNQLLGAVDAAVVGRLGEVELGAVGLGSGIYFTLAVVGLGLVVGFDPLVAQALGSGEPDDARRSYRHAARVAILATVPLSILIAAVVYILPHAGIAADSAEATRVYVLTRLPGLGFFLALVAARGLLSAHGVTRPLIIGVVLANLVNLPVSWALVFGDASLEPLGLPAQPIPRLGIAGAGWASTVSTFIQCAIAVYALRSLPGRAAPRHFDPELMKRGVRLGLPVAGTLLAEVGVFGLSSYFAGLLGQQPLAAHNVALMLASTTFQVPLGIGIAASVRVGHAIGREDTPGARKAGFLALGMAMVFMTTTAALFVFLPASLARIFTPDPNVIAAVLPLLAVAAIFQLADGAQVVASGALRGAGDTRFPFVANVVGHYVVGLPLSLGLAFGLGWGARGIWVGLSAGLFAVAILLVRRFARVSAKTIARV
jgi:MATE family multidrug resistance protein